MIAHYHNGYCASACFRFDDGDNYNDAAASGKAMARIDNSNDNDTT